MRRQRVLLLTLLTFGATFLQSASATPVTVPVGLNLGDQYRLAFVTSTTTDATSNDITTYNQIVANVAAGVPELAALGTTWKAIASTDVISARNNTNSNPSSSPSAPIYLLDGVNSIATGNAGLWSGGLLHQLNIDQTGTAVAPTSVWTGTDTDGTEWNNAGFGPASGLGDLPQPILGVTNSFFSSWVVAFSQTPDNQHPLYALSGILTVVPEPTSLILALAATSLLVLAPRRRTA